MSDTNPEKFAGLTFDDFRRRANDPELSPCEKVGFPDSYRAGKESVIFEDILSKLPLLGGRGQVVLEIGPGCSHLPVMLVEVCRAREHRLILVDSEEMLAHLPDAPFVTKIAACYPSCESLFETHRGSIGVILTYSVLHHVFAEANVWEFMDRSLELLAPGGEMLIGDLPNVSKRKRFFASAAGVRFHREFSGTSGSPDVSFNQVERKSIDDAVIVSLLLRARSAGFDAYLLPQGPGLPMANRREDILIRRP